VPAALIDRLVCNYGTAWRDVVAMTTPHAPAIADATMPGASSLQPLGASCDVTRAEVLYAVREEMAVTLADALLRRTEAGTRGYPGQDAVQAAATIMGEELGWTEARRAREVQSLGRVYEAATMPGI